MANSNFLPPKGFRDLLPKQMIIRNQVVDTLRSVFESYGFQPLQTPTLEYASTLTGKYGEEADKLLYLFQDRGDRQVGLNYDLTVPTARVLSAYQDLPKPFKRYQIQPAYRAENPQKGRYRQFTQCDIDIIGSSSPLADAEILAVINDSLRQLSLPNFTIQINSRQVLFNLIESAGIPEKLKFSTIQTIDKLDKKTKEQVVEELRVRRLTQKQIEKLFQSLETSQPDDFLKQTIDLAKQMGVPKNKIKFSPTLARGLDYYTGPIFETIVEKPKIGSVTGGGRYDQLIKQLGGPDLPATGTTIGLDRLCDVLEELKLQQTQTTTTVLVTIFSEKLLPDSLKLANYLREGGINTEVALNPQEKLDKQLKYADKKGIPFVIIFGPEEQASDTAVLKDLRNQTQKVLPIEDLVTQLY